MEQGFRVYRWVRIMDEELAAALPAGTIARHGDPVDGVYTAVVQERKGERIWESIDAGERCDAEMIGWSALVPLAPGEGR